MSETSIELPPVSLSVVVVSVCVMFDDEPCPHEFKPPDGPERVAVLDSRWTNVDLPPLDNARLASDGASGLTDDQLCAAVLQLRLEQRAVDAAQATLLAELDVRGVCDRDFGHDTGKWVARELHEPANLRQRAVLVARKLRTLLPETHEALAVGLISEDHARVFAQACNPRIELELAAMQSVIIERATEIGFKRWQTELHHIIELLDADGAYDPDRERERTKASVVPLFNGTTQLHAEFGEADGLVVNELLNAEADRLFHQYKQDHAVDPSIDIPRRPELLARAVLSLFRKGSAVDMASSIPPRVEVSLVIREETPDVVELPDGRTMKRHLLDELLVDPTCRHVLMSDTGNVLSLGTTRRFATVAQRRALAIRDGGCVFPGCDHGPAWTDAHHVIQHQDGGETIMKNLALLCRHHHGVTHRAGWHMTAQADQTFTWTTPAGDTIASQRHGTPVGASNRMDAALGQRKPRTE